MRRRQATSFNCFSPPVMLATLIIESCLAVYTVWRYKLNVLGRLMVIMLLMLATFQLAEYFVCTGYGLRAEQWSRLGFVAITTLPALGMHILHVLAGKPQRKLVAAGYILMAGFIVFFLTYHTAFIGHKCTGNYVIFQMGPKVGGTYLVYYYALLFGSLGLGARWANEFMKQGKGVRNRLQAIRALMIGYLVFIVPTILANTVRPSTMEGLPSIMCGFAVLFALILALYIAPRAAVARRTTADPASEPR